MKILVINGDCIKRNSSANLCHLAYIRGLLQAGHEVTLLSASENGYETDSHMQIPSEVKQYTYSGLTLYEKLSMKKLNGAMSSDASGNSAGKNKKSVKANIVGWLKRLVLRMYGMHGIYSKFVRTAQRFKSAQQFDFVISLSTPVTSHLLTHNLIKKKHIKATHWIQIWEDPWYTDAYGFNGKEKIREEEARLLSFAEKVCYVSPLTLQNQQRLYPESAHKMFWQPLPSYYNGDSNSISESNELSFGYFGDYAPASRDLKPFYEAAVEMDISVNICGDPSNLFVPTANIKIYPRLTLDKLKPIEDSTNVLIFLCNRKGGQIPGKIYQYSATTKTILFILDGTEEEKAVLRDYFEKYNRYVFCENTVESIKEAIEKIKNNDLSGITNTPINSFSPELIVEKILKME
ncbi:MAG: glycosyltransferase family 4 protein [Ruminococcaceae bacterium]|nr:glycosyltransferase family 4 protein [Oscillospiraceae bacterium]